MILRTRQSGEIIVFDLEGQLDFETTQEFENHCMSILKETPNAKLVLNMQKLRFVGSSGINQFVKVLKEFNSQPQKPRLCHISSEFRKIFLAYQTSRNPFRIHESEPEAMVSFEAESLVAPSAPKKPRKKSKRPN